MYIYFLIAQAAAATPTPTAVAEKTALNPTFLGILVGFVLLLMGLIEAAKKWGLIKNPTDIKVSENTEDIEKMREQLQELLVLCSNLPRLRAQIDELHKLHETPVGKVPSWWCVGKELRGDINSILSMLTKLDQSDATTAAQMKKIVKLLTHAIKRINQIGGGGSSGGGSLNSLEIDLEGD